MEFPIDKKIIASALNSINAQDPAKLSIREIKKLADIVEKETGTKFIRMEIGVPGFPLSQIAVKGEKEALDNGVGSLYPHIEGIPELKTEISNFVKNFVNIDVNPAHCVTTVGSINGCFATFAVAGRAVEGKDTVLFIDPGFPVHKTLTKMLGLKSESFDVYDHRGSKLKDKLEEYLSKGNISVIVYSNPNNPTWMCFNDEELKIIGDLSNKYGVVIMEDLAYFSMDFRKDLSRPGLPPYQDTVAKYTDNYIMLISSSKSFSYPGQRIGMMCISDKLYEKDFQGLSKYYSTINFGKAIVYGTLHPVSGGTAHSAQYGLLALLKKINSGDHNFLEEVSQYSGRAAKVKEIFLKNGFHIVYPDDIDEPIADGFYFTAGYKDYKSDDLAELLLNYGISALSLAGTGAEKQGVRACVSFIAPEQYPDLDIRLKKFNKNN